MTLLGKIFRPWDLASNESFIAKSNEAEEDRVRDKISDVGNSSSDITIKEEGRRHMSSSKSERSGSRRVSEDSGGVSGSKRAERRNLPTMSISLRDIKSEDGSSGSSVAHFLDLNPSGSPSLPYFISSGPVSTPTTASSFMSSSSINELASLSRTELTAMGLLPPEPPSSMKVKRQRPKRFRCPHCQVAFSNNGQLRGHIRIHTGERPFSCEHEGCGKSFTRNEELTRHRRIHTGLRPYPCTHCGKKFGRKDHLKKHTRTHQRSMYNASSGMIGLGHPFHPFNPSLIPSHSAINEFASASSPYALPFMLSIPPPISHFPFS